MTREKGKDEKAEYAKALLKLEQVTPEMAAGFPKPSRWPDSPLKSSHENSSSSTQPPPRQKPKHHGLGQVYQRNEIWWVVYYYRGVRHRESSNSINQKDAVKLLKKRVGEMSQGKLVGRDIEKTTFEDLMEIIRTDYKINERRSIRRLHTSIKALTETFAYHRAVNITLDKLNDYVASRIQDGIASSSIRNELSCLKRAFRLAARAGKAVPPPFPSVQANNVRTGFFEREAFEAVRFRLPQDLQSLFTVAYHTGWRARSELLPLTWNQVDFKAGTLRLEVGSTKNSEGRVFPFTMLPELADTIKIQRERTTTLERATAKIIPFVFHRTGKPIKEFKGAWRKACKEAGFPTMIPHDFRRTAVRNLERAGVSRSVAMKLTGHKTESVYRRYAIVSESDLTEGVKKLAALTQRTDEESKGQVVSLATIQPQLRQKHG